MSGRAEGRDEQVGMKDGVGARGQPGHVLYSAVPSFVLLPWHVLGLPASLGSSGLRALNSLPSPPEGAFVSPLFALSSQRSWSSSPLLSLSHASHFFLEGKLGGLSGRAGGLHPVKNHAGFMVLFWCWGDRPTGLCVPSWNTMGAALLSS